MEEIIKNPGLQRIIEDTAILLNVESISSFRLVNHHWKNIVDRPTFYLKKWSRENFSKDLIKDWENVCQNVDNAEMEHELLLHMFKMCGSDVTYPLSSALTFLEVTEFSQLPELVFFILENVNIKNYAKKVWVPQLMLNIQHARITSQITILNSPVLGGIERQELNRLRKLKFKLNGIMNSLANEVSELKEFMTKVNKAYDNIIDEIAIMPQRVDELVLEMKNLLYTFNGLNWGLNVREITDIVRQPIEDYVILGNFMHNQITSNLILDIISEEFWKIVLCSIEKIIVLPPITDQVVNTYNYFIVISTGYNSKT